MDEIAIKRHSFDLAKKRLKDFSEKREAELQIEKVQTESRIFPFIDHKVTGEELNTRLETIQEHFIAVNTTNSKVIKEFREVYNALDALDKDYMASIIANVKAIEKTSNDIRVQQRTLKQHHEKLADQQSKLDAHQVEIEKNIVNISKIVATLKIFKEKLESYQHLTDIDEIWNDCKTIQNEIRVVADSITMFAKKVAEDIATANNENKVISEQINKVKENFDSIENSLQSMKADILKTQKHFEEIVAVLFKKLSDAEEYALNSRNLITELEAFRAEASALNHLMEVDEIWKQAENHQIRIIRVEQESKSHTDKLNELEQADGKIRENIASNAYDIHLLKEYKEKLSGISHLKDVDSIWEAVKKHTSKLVEYEKRGEEFAAAIQKNKEEANENIAEAVQISNTAIETLTKKVKYLYWIAGGSAGLAIIEFILLFVKVI